MSSHIGLVGAAQDVVAADENPQLRNRGGVLVCRETDRDRVFQEVEHWSVFLSEFYFWKRSRSPYRSPPAPYMRIVLQPESPLHGLAANRIDSNRTARPRFSTYRG